MKTLQLCISTALLLISFRISAQQQNTPGVGIGINQLQKDFGIGLHLVSPYFANNRVAVRAGANLQWLQHMKGNETTWSPYGSFQLGIRGRQPVIEDKIYLYGEGGSILLLPNSTFSTEKAHWGGYGLFGFEFWATPKFGYYLELGGVGTGAKANKVSAAPIYANGFTGSVGCRLHF